jgi:hypothetical protein
MCLSVPEFVHQDVHPLGLAGQLPLDQPIRPHAEAGAQRLSAGERRRPRIT